MTVVVQPAFWVEVLALKTKRVVDFVDVEAADFAIRTVMRRPDDFAVGIGEFLRRTKVVELVVVGLGFLWTKAFQQRQWPEAFRFVEVTAMAIRLVFGDESVALPEELGSCAINGLADPPPKRVIAIAGSLAVGFFNPDQPVLAVVAILGDELMTFAATFADEVAEGVVVVVVVALDHQAIARHDVWAGAVLHE